MSTLPYDLRFAWRRLRRSLGFSVVVILTLALGIGATTAVFTVVRGVLLRAMPFEEPDQLVRIFTITQAGDAVNALSAPNFMSLQEQSRAFAGMATFGFGTAALTGIEEPRDLNSASVSAGYFDLLGIQPILGRVFRAEENQRGRQNVTILGYALWQELFGADPQVLGKAIMLDGRARTVVGVLPHGYGSLDDQDVWIPLEYDESFSAATDHDRESNTNFPVLARLRRGVTLERAVGELRAIGKRLEADFPASNTNVSFTALGLRDEIVADVRSPLYVLLAAVGLVLLISCANVASLVLARSASRRRELAVRVALGASKRRVVQEFLTDSIVLGLLGGALGLLLAVWGTAALVAAQPEGLPRLDDIRVDAAVLAFALSVTLLTSILVGLVPARRAIRGMRGMPRAGEGGALGDRSTSRFRGGLVVAEIALTMVLLAGAGLLIHSFLRLVSVDPGFETQQILTFRVNLPGGLIQYPSRSRSFYDRLRERIRHLPGVQSVGAIHRLPIAQAGFSSRFRAEGWPPSQLGESEPRMTTRSVTPDYFHTMRIPLRRGRGFTESDRNDTPRVILINEAAARTYFRGEEPIGRRVIWFSNSLLGIELDGEPATIVGVVCDIRRDALDSAPDPEAYFPHAQVPFDNMNLVVRTAGEPLDLAPTIQQEIRALEPQVVLPAFHAFEDLVSDSVARPRFLATLLALFGGAALLLAAIGLFGLLSFNVARQTREIGIRMALGAQPAAVVWAVVRRPLALVCMGVALGALGALAITRLMESVLYEVGPTDPATFVSVVLVFVATAIAAGVIPARRAAAVDPVTALRYD